MQFPRVEINRRHMRARQLTSHLLHIIEPYLREGVLIGDVGRQIEDLFWSQGAQVITEAMRIEAGLPIRDHNGMTMDELKIIEARLLEAMYRPMAPMVVPDRPSEPIVKLNTD